MKRYLGSLSFKEFSKLFARVHEDAIVELFTIETDIVICEADKLLGRLIVTYRSDEKRCIVYINTLEENKKISPEKKRFIQ